MSTSNGTEHYDFDPVQNVAGGKILPEAGKGRYTMTIDDVTVGVKEDKEWAGKKFPQLRYSIKLSNAEDEENKIYEGKKITLYYTHAPDLHPSFQYKRDKRTHQALAGAADIDLSLIPEEVRAKSDFDDIIAAAKGKSFEGWITHREHNGETYLGFAFSDPGSTSEPEEPVPPPPPPERRPAAKAAPKAAPGKSRR